MAPASGAGATTSVQVAVRIRPTTTQDASSIPSRFQRTVVHALGSNAVSIDPVGPGAAVAAGQSGGAGGGTPMSPGPGSSSAAGSKKQTFAFDHVLSPSCTQHDVFVATAQPLISRFLDGFNCTMLAYGQTSSGKTFTMTGVDLDRDANDISNNMGIIPRSVATIFARAQQLRDERAGAWSYTIKGSFLELYNEDLIDLLDESPARRDVQIREDKDGHILLGGLREVPVRSPAEVMGLIRQGTAIRTTNATDMNAQSSRSHAIFSLTLTQRKFSGSGPPPRSSSPLPPGRSPSRLARPGSMLPSSRMSMQASRPGTPSFQRTPGARPASSLGVHGADRGIEDQSGEGEWTTIVSKFHFVDLAGSERLKRTAAQGERVKEGISINSGLLALGNVISALGDPARARSNTATHVPYRDSKLTRLLQDSLGGNAHTLMIACVSPAEYNAAETVNTLKYANRARNIKNRAVIAEKEEGWEDVEWLQGQIIRLRKELKGLKDGGSAGGAILAASGSLDSNATATTNGAGEGASRRVREQLTALQTTYEDLRGKYTQRTEELTRLRRELAERPAPEEEVNGTARYEELVGPVIEEYEKTISAMEAELSLNRAALRHTNDLVEEKEDELTAAAERHASAELYIEELKARVAKLGEREASTEAYVHDLEEKVRRYDESSVSSSGSITDLKRELARFRDADAHSVQYIADLEQRLARADESVLGLQKTVERLEHDVDRRRAEAEALQARLAALTKDSEAWRTDLEERERRVQELEERLKEWERVRTEAGEERARLGIIVNGVEKEKQGLVASPPASPSVAMTPVPALNGDGHSEPGTPVQRPALGLNTEVQLATLQETHAATLADLSSVSAKYRDALREISDLAAQIQEAKLNGSSAASDTSAPSGLGVEKVEAYAVQQARRRMGSDSPSRRLLFRHAASSESLHSRSVSQAVSLSQELSSAHGRKTSFSTNGSSSPMAGSPSRRPNLSLSLSSPTIHNAQHDAQQRSISSMEKEIMRLQEVLKERETEIAALETSLREAQTLPMSQHQQSASLPALTPDVPGTPESPSSAGVVSPPDHLSPNTLRQFGEIRKAIHPADVETTSSISTVSEADENLERLNELMRSMAQKESAHREIVDDLTSQLAQVQRQHDDLSTLSRNQALNMSSELEGMRKEHVDRLSQLEDLQKRELELMDVLKTANVEHNKAIAELQASHERALEVKGAEVDALIANLKAEHELALADAQAKLAASASALEAAHAEHEQAFGKLKAEHEEAQRQRAAEVEELLSRTHEEHAAALAAAAAEHEASLKRKEEEHQETLAKNEEDYYNALMRLRDSHAQMLEKQAADAAASLARSQEEHESALRMADLAREASLSESQSGHLSVLQELQNEQANAAAAKEAAWQDELQRVRESHERIQEAKASEHQDALNRLRSEHAAALSKTQAEALKQVDDLKTAHALSQQEASAASLRAQQEADQTLRMVQEQQAAVLQEIERGHGEEVASLKASHSESLEKVSSKAAELEQSLQRATEDAVKLKADHQQAIAEVNSRLVAVQEERLKDITSSREQSEAHAIAEKERLQRLLTEMEASHMQERETLRKSHDLLASELASYKATAEQYLTERDALREERDKLSEQVAVMRARLDAHSTEQDSTKAVHNTISQELSAQTSLAQRHAAERDELQQALDAVIAESASFKTQSDARSKELEQLRTTHSDLLEELAAHQAAADEYQASQQAMRSAHETAIAEHSAIVASVSAELDTVRGSSSALETQLAALKAELESTHKAQVTLQHSASSRDKLATELEKQRTALAEMQDELQRTRDALVKEKAKSEGAAREFEARLARTPSPEQPSQPHTSISARARMTSLPPAKLPPSVPMPAPPVPTDGTIASSVGSTNSILSQASSGAETTTTTGTSVSASMTERTVTVQDPKLLAQVAAQTQHIEEQDAMIKTLNKQLTHCESDLQAHMDLVSTLETSLGDCEKNLRKARMQATELARERDSLNGQVEGLRRQVTDSQRQVENVRQSIVEEKQSLESRLDEERKAKERAKAQLDARMTEITKRKSKFACL